MEHVSRKPSVLLPKAFYYFPGWLTGHSYYLELAPLRLWQSCLPFRLKRIFCFVLVRFLLPFLWGLRLVQHAVGNLIETVHADLYLWIRHDSFLK